MGLSPATEPIPLCDPVLTFIQTTVVNVKAFVDSLHLSRDLEKLKAMIAMVGWTSLSGDRPKA
jgi:hypothetical protein